MKKIAVLSANSDSEFLRLEIEKLGARCTILPFEDLAKSKADEFEAIVLSGNINHSEALSILIRKFHDDSKPIAAIAGATAVIALALGADGVTLAIVESARADAEIAKTGAYHENCELNDFITDREHKVISTPASEGAGILKALSELFEMS